MNLRRNHPLLYNVNMIEEHRQRRTRRRSRFHATMTVAMSVCCALLFAPLRTTAALPLPADPFLEVGGGDSTTARDEMEDISNDEEGEKRVSIHEFKMQVDYPSSEKAPDADVMHDILQDFLTLYVSENAKANNQTLDYLVLADVEVSSTRRRRLQQQFSTLDVRAGVASFTSESFPTDAELASTIEQGVETAFVSYLQSDDNPSNPSYDYIASADYISLTTSPTSSPQPQPQPTASTANVNETKRSSIIAVGAVGAFIGVILIAAALLVRHRRGPSLDAHLERDFKDNETHIESSLHGGSNSNDVSDNRGGAFRDDSSVWTISTMPDDGKTVVTSFSNKSHRSATGGAIHRAESFERDRQVSLRKDMLHTSPSWNNTDNVREDPALGGKAKVDDTVLQPSHFRTDDEVITTTPPSVEDDAEVFRFAANDEGEEIYLMPPATRRKHKSVSYT